MHAYGCTVLGRGLGDEEYAYAVVGQCREYAFVDTDDADHLKELNCLTATAFARLSRCELTAAERNDGTQVLAGKLALGQVARPSANHGERALLSAQTRSMI